VKSRVIHRLVATAVVACLSLPALGQSSRDAGANQKIDEAVNHQYLMMELDKAESILKNVVTTCGNQCSPEVIARAWMYVGIVRGSGKNDLAGASEAFATAQSIDPNVQLDRDLASPETQATFDSLSGTAPPPTTTTSAPPAVLDAGEIPGDMNCNLDQGVRVTSRMPIPISCTTNASATEAVLKFKEYGSNDWKKVDLTNSDGAFEGVIPCDVTQNPGPLQWFVGAKNAAGEYVDQWGSKKSPAVVQIVQDGGVELTYSDGSAVARCPDSSDCPPDFPGCGTSSKQCGNLDWGASCKNSSECKCGLLCESGTCNNAPSCSSNEECSTGYCENGLCAVDPHATSSSGPFQRHWVSLGFAADMVNYGGEQLCDPSRDPAVETVCVDGNGAVIKGNTDMPDPGAATAEINNGFQLSQYRIHLGYDFAFSPRLLLGARLGYIIGGNPVSFLPVHAELRGTYNVFPINKIGLRLPIHLGFGVGDLDFAIANVPSSAGPLTVYKKGGNLFTTLGAGLGYAFMPNLSADIRLAAVVSLPTFNLAIQPGLNLTYGF